MHHQLDLTALLRGYGVVIGYGVCLGYIVGVHDYQDALVDFVADDRVAVIGITVGVNF